MMHAYTKNEFLSLPTRKIAEIVESAGAPRTGIFIPDGNRRMTMAFSGLNPSDEAFCEQYVNLTTSHFIRALETFFSHGIKTLVVPLVSPNVLKRNNSYIKSALLPGLQKILAEEEWRDFYAQHQVRVHYYGNLQALAENGCGIAKDWLLEIRDATLKYRTIKLFYGIAAPTQTHTEIAQLSIDFFQKHNRVPTHEELIIAYYGTHITPAQIFIMSTKFSGAGALPPLIVDLNTQMYVLASPGVYALNPGTYRQILYDLLYSRGSSDFENEKVDPQNNYQKLKEFYVSHRSTVFGIGERINRFWVPIK